MDGQLTHDQAEPCESCGGRTQRMLYPDAAGCGHALIEMWRCVDCGKVTYGNIVGGEAWDAVLDGEESGGTEGEGEPWPS